MKITVSSNGQKHGPYTAEEINTRLAEGEFKPNDWAWPEDAMDWVPLASINGIGSNPAKPAPLKKPPFYRRKKVIIGSVIVVILLLVEYAMEKDAQRQREWIRNSQRKTDAILSGDRDEYNRLEQADEIARRINR